MSGSTLFFLSSIESQRTNSVLDRKRFYGEKKVHLESPCRIENLRRFGKLHIQDIVVLEKKCLQFIVQVAKLWITKKEQPFGHSFSK